MLNEQNKRQKLEAQYDENIAGNENHFEYMEEKRDIILTSG